MTNPPELITMIPKWACQHTQTEPVQLVTGEIVAKVCVACLASVPSWYGCPDCEVEDLKIADRIGHVGQALTRPCPTHTAELE